MSRNAARRRGPLTLAMLAVLSLAVGLRSLTPRPADAILQTTDVCGSSGSTPFTINAGIVECDYKTLAVIPTDPPGTLTLQLLSPLGTQFTGTGTLPGSLPFGCSSQLSTTAMTNDTVTISCAVGTAGLPKDSTVALLLLAGPNPGQILMNGDYLTKDPNDPLGQHLIVLQQRPVPGLNQLSFPPFAYQFDAFSGPIIQYVNPPPPIPGATPAHEVYLTTLTATNPLMQSNITCAISPPGPAVIGATISCTVTYPGAGNTPSFVSVVPSGGVSLNSGPTGSTRPSPDSAGWLCGSLTTIPGPPPQLPPPPVTETPCTTFTFTAVVHTTDTPSFTIRSFALGAAIPYDAPTLCSNVSFGGAACGAGGGGGGGGGGGSGGFIAVGTPLLQPTTPPTPTNLCGSLAAAAVANTFTFQCDYLSQAPVAASPTGPASLAIQVVAPASGVVFTATNPVTASAGIPGCSVAGGGTSLITINCPSGSAPIPAGTVLQLHLTSSSVTNIQLQMNATYTSPGTPPAPPTVVTVLVPPFNYQFDTWAGPAANTQFNGTGSPAITCYNTNPAKTLTSPVTVGDSFVCAVNYPPSQTPSFVVVTAANNPATVGAGTVASYRPAPNSTGFPCDSNTPPPAPGGPNPIPPPTPPPMPPPTPGSQACVRFFFIGMAATLGTPQFTIRSFALGAALPYDTTTTTATLGGGGPILVIGAPAGPVTSALGCANGTQTNDVSFPALPTMQLASSTQFATTPPLSPTASVPAVLSVITPNVAVICGAVFEDAGSFATDKDADPRTIDGGTITYTLSSTIAIITETNTTTDTISCGTATPPAGFESCVGAQFYPGSSSPPLVPPFLTPNPSNIIHVALQPGASFGLLAGAVPVVSLSATYTRFTNLGPPKTLTTNTANIPVAIPPYQMTLSASPGAIPDASGLSGAACDGCVSLAASPAAVASAGSSAGATITASLFHPGVTGCIAIAGVVGFVACAGSPVLFGFGLVPAVEGGLVTFTTDAGVLAGATDSPGSAAQLQLTLHCGPIPGSPPVIFVPTLGSAATLATALAFTSCVSIQAVLFGAGAAGTATVTASFIGDITGATAQAVTTVALTLAPPSVALTRGCNEVITGSGTVTGTPVSQIASQVVPSNVVLSIWRFNNSTHGWDAGYFSTPGAPVDFTTTGPTQSLFICVSGAGLFQP